MNKKLKILFILLLFLIPASINSPTTDFIKKEKIIINYYRNNNAKKYEDIIKIISKKYNLDCKLIYALIEIESDFNHKAKGDGGKAIGLGQIHLPTAKEIDYKVTEKKLKNPNYNIEMICKILKKYSIEFNNDPIYMVAAYNGPKSAKRAFLKNNIKLLKNKEYIALVFTRYNLLFTNNT